MDVRMPGVDGIEATRRLMACGGDALPRVLILTTFDLDEYVFDALRAGASGFLLKDFTAERSFDAARGVGAGGRRLPRLSSTVRSGITGWTVPCSAPSARGSKGRLSASRTTSSAPPSGTARPATCRTCSWRKPRAGRARRER